MKKSKITHVNVGIAQYHEGDNDVIVSISRVTINGDRKVRTYNAYDWQTSKEQRLRFAERGIRAQRAFLERGD